MIGVDATVMGFFGLGLGRVGVRPVMLTCGSDGFGLSASAATTSPVACLVGFLFFGLRGGLGCSAQNVRRGGGAEFARRK